MVSVRGNQTNNKVTASSSTSTNNKAEVKPISINNQVEATNNLAKYYSEISQDWAVGEGLIQGIDYSSKTYALQAKEYANEAKESMEITQGYMDNAISNIQSAETSALNNIVMQEESASLTIEQGVEQLNTTITEGVETIETLQSNSLAEITTNKETALNDITTAETNVLANIDTSKLNTLAQIEELANSSIEDINATGIDTKVSKSGDTMTGDLIVEKEVPNIVLKNSNIESSVPSNVDAGVSYFAIHDKNGQAMGQIGLERYTNGKQTIKLQAFSADGTFAPAIRVHANADNTAKFTLTDNPATTSNGTEIATTSFCDGNWTYKFLALASAATLSNTANTTYSLASYLPNDGRTYEVLFSFNGSATAASQYNIDTGFGTVYCFAPIKTNISGCMILPVTTRRTIIIQPTTLTKGTNTYSFRVNAYRKVR